MMMRRRRTASSFMALVNYYVFNATNEHDKHDTVRTLTCDHSTACDFLRSSKTRRGGQ